MITLPKNIEKLESAIIVFGVCVSVTLLACPTLKNALQLIHGALFYTYTAIGAARTRIGIDTFVARTYRFCLCYVLVSISAYVTSRSLVKRVRVFI